MDNAPVRGGNIAPGILLHQSHPGGRMALRLLHQVWRRSRYGDTPEPAISQRCPQALRKVWEASVAANSNGYGPFMHRSVGRAVKGSVSDLQRLFSPSERMHPSKLLRNSNRHPGNVAGRVLRELGYGTAMV